MIPAPTLTAIETILCILAVIVLLVAILLTYGYSRLDKRILGARLHIAEVVDDLSGRIRRSNEYSDKSHDLLLDRIVWLEDRERRRSRIVPPAPVKLVKKDPGDGGGSAA